MGRHAVSKMRLGQADEKILHLRLECRRCGQCSTAREESPFVRQVRHGQTAFALTALVAERHRSDGCIQPAG